MTNFSIENINEDVRVNQVQQIINIQPELLLKLKKAVCNISFQIDSATSTGSGFYFYDKPEDLQKGHNTMCCSNIIAVTAGNQKIKTDKAYIENPRLRCP